MEAPCHKGLALTPEFIDNGSCGACGQKLPLVESHLRCRSCGKTYDLKGNLLVSVQTPKLTEFVIPIPVVEPVVTEIPVPEPDPVIANDDPVTPVNVVVLTEPDVSSQPIVTVEASESTVTPTPSAVVAEPVKPNS